MKKLIVMFMFLIGLTVNATMIDGSYYVEKNVNGHWKPFVKILIKGNKIIGVQYDKRDKSGNLLSINQMENDKYKDVYGETFRDMSFKLSRNFVVSQNIDKLEKIEDMKNFEEFKEMINYLIEKANEGKSGEHKM